MKMNNLKFNTIVIIIIIIIIMTIDFIPSEMSNRNEVSEISFKNIMAVLLGGITQKKGFHRFF